MSVTIINLFGGPGTGKSTTAAELFAKMKQLGYRCEYISEYAKDLTYRKSFTQLSDSGYVFSKQHHRIWTTAPSVDFIITDSPLLLSLVYLNPEDTIYRSNYKPYVLEVISGYKNINFFLQRNEEEHKYQQYGRTQTLTEAMVIDGTILELLKESHDFLRIPIKDATEVILNKIKEIDESNKKSRTKQR